MSAPARKAAIITFSANGSIGKPGESTTLWTSLEDKQWFQKVTKDIREVAMGNGTYGTIGRPLPGRMNYVITRSPEKIQAIEGQLRALTLDQFKALNLNEYCVLGGPQIWRELNPMVDVVYVSKHREVLVEGEMFALDQSRLVLFNRKELRETIQEIYTQPSFVHPDITIEYDDNEYMRMAEDSAKELSLDKNHPTGAILVKDGKVIASVANGSRWHEEHMNDPELKAYAGCRRKLLKCPSGTGYEHCEGCSNENHSEARSVIKARESGFDPTGATCYLWGHWWCCEPCARALVSNGVKHVVVSKKWTKDFLGIVTD